MCVPIDVDLWICQQRRGRSDRFHLGRRLFLRWMHRRQLCRVRPMSQLPVIIGTRGSQLALWQAHWVQQNLTAAHSGVSFQQKIIKTKGDKILDVPLAQVGGKGLFVKEIEDQLLAGEIDLAVHSMKDMPAELPDGLCVGPIPVRENPFDVLISRSKEKLDQLPPNAVVGTSSLRRGAQLKKIRPDLHIISLRGNLDTRIRKLEQAVDGLDAIVLAAAGVRRLGFEAHITEMFTAEQMLPAVAQGALCIELRCNDRRIESLVNVLNDAPTRQVVLGERAYLGKLGGSCQIPVAGHGRIEAETFVIEGLVADVKGREVLRAMHSGPVDESERIGKELADQLLASGGDKILSALTGA